MGLKGGPVTSRDWTVLCHLMDLVSGSLELLV